MSPLSLSNKKEFQPIIPTSKKSAAPANDRRSKRYFSVELDPSVISKIIPNKKYLRKEIFQKEYRKYPECITSKKPFAPIKAYAMNTYQGIVRDYNDDKIVAITNVNKPQSYKGLWPKISYFGVFDGHAGDTCSTFLQKHLLNFIINHKSFPLNPKDAIKGGFDKAAEEWQKAALENENGNLQVKDQSGSCAVIALIIESRAFIANVGDSRAIISYDGGKKIKQITIDHKPNLPKEKERILKAGGEVIVDKLTDEEKEELVKVKKEEKDKARAEGKEVEDDSSSSDDYLEDEIYRVKPGGLAVSRSIGDIPSKLKEFGGLPGGVISTPDIFEVDLPLSTDFILMGCDGIFDVLKSEDVVEAAWFAETFSENCGENMHLRCANYVDYVLKAAMALKSADNLSVIIIGLPNLEKVVHSKLIKEKVQTAIKK